MEPIPYTLSDKTITFTMPHLWLNVNDGEFGYSFESREVGGIDTKVLGFTNNTHNAAVPEPSIIFFRIWTCISCCDWTKKV